MRRPSRTAAGLLALSGVACSVDRSGAGTETAGATAGSGAAVNVESGGSGGLGGSGGGIVVSGGSAGVFGIAMGNAGGDAGSGNQNHPGGASGMGGSGTGEPVDSGSTAVDVGATNDADTASEVTTVASCESHAGGQTFTPNGAVGAHCYWPHSGKSTWQAAVDACMAQGGHLATITSAAENTFVVKLITNFGTADRLWLGGTDNKAPTDESGGGPYVWITGEPFSYAPWAMNNPDGACANTCDGQRCCQHRVCVDRDGVFWDREEAALYFSVCESEP